MVPIARTENLLIQAIGNELIVYDQKSNASHCLNPVAARVWHYCDGQHSIKDIARLLEKELNISQTEAADIRGLVWLTLEELERYQLIEKYLKQPTGIANISRRQVVKTGVLVGGFALGSMFPAIKSVAVPDPGGAQSTGNPKKDCFVCKCCTTDHDICGKATGIRISNLTRNKTKEKVQKDCNQSCKSGKGTFTIQCEDTCAAKMGLGQIYIVCGSCTCQ